MREIISTTHVIETPGPTPMTLLEEAHALADSQHVAPQPRNVIRRLVEALEAVEQQLDYGQHQAAVEILHKAINGEVA